VKQKVEEKYCFEFKKKAKKKFLSASTFFLYIFTA
jgi:hypothetical protein